MIVAVDYDGTVADTDGRPYDSPEVPALVSGVRDGLMALKRAGHKLILFSCRANRALREDPMLDPLVRAGVKRLDRAAWEKARPVHEARYQRMLEHVEAALPGVFDAVDDGRQGKPEAQLYIDNLALRFGHGLRGSSWATIATEYGAPVKKR